MNELELLVEELYKSFLVAVSNQKDKPLWYAWVHFTSIKLKILMYMVTDTFGEPSISAFDILRAKQNPELYEEFFRRLRRSAKLHIFT